MVTTLRIKNLALVSDLTLELEPGFNAVTGETGAGKSIIIGALKLVLGERADKTLIRSGTDTCAVEAVFDIRNIAAVIKDILDKNGLEQCEEHQLVLKRTFTSAGTNRQFVNGSPTSLSILAQVGDVLVDMHGPHDHQSLIHPGKQLAILDSFGGLAPLKQRFDEVLRRKDELLAQKAELIVDEKTYAQQLDLLRFQVNEISSAQLHDNEEAELEKEYHRASNAAKLLELSRLALGALAEDEPSMISIAGVVGRSVHELQRLDPGAACFATLHSQAVEYINELNDQLSHYADRLDIDPARLQSLGERLDSIQGLKRKYGATIADILAFGDDAASKLQALEQRDTEIARLNDALKVVDGELQKAGAALSKARRAVIPKMTKAAKTQLNDLGFKQNEFDVALQTDSPHESSRAGFDTIEFLFSPNPGEPPRPLRSIASSGEMARVMLGLKTALAAQDDIPVLVFDEVDANVGGETANVVGAKMRQLAEHRQVLCITHLPQVAACASAHFVVAKQIADERTISTIKPLSGEDRVTELARMLGGNSEAARRHAKTLIKTTPKNR